MNATEHENEIYAYYLTLYTEEYEKYDLFSTAVFIAEIVFTFFGVMVNFVVCGVLLRKKRLLKNFSNFHLFNLALTDFFFRVAITPVIFTIENTIVESGNKALCQLSAFAKYTTLASTFLLLLGIAFDRFIHIVHPLKARNITWKHSRNVVVISWLYGAACSLPFLFDTQFVKIDGNATESVEYELCLLTAGLAFQVSSTGFLIFAFLIPLVMMGAAYSAIVKVLWMRARRNLMNAQIAKAKFRAVKMMLIVIVSYLISWGPMLIWSCLQAFEVVSLKYNVDWESEEISWEEKLQQEKRYITLSEVDGILELLTYTSSVLNPFIFAYYNNSFRQELKTCCCGKNRVNCTTKRERRVKKETANPRSFEAARRSTERRVYTTRL